MTVSEKLVVDAVSAENVRAHVEHIVTHIPSRLAGSENAKRMAEYGAGALRAAGVEAAVHELPALVSFPGHANVRVLSPAGFAIEANTLGHSLATPPGGVSGEVVYVASGGFSDYEGKDAAGRIVLCELSYSPARHEKQRIAGLKGAIAAIMMNWGRPGDTAVPFGSVKPAWGNPTPETMKSEMPVLPCVGIARAAGLRLKEMCRQGAVRVQLATQVEDVWRPVQITVGEIPARRSAEFVVVGGHQDSWPGEAATDNAAGNACMIELARVFSPVRDKLRRGLVFGFWTAHETGTMAGSSWYVDRNWDRLREHAVAYFLIDQPACTGTTRWATRSNVEMRRFHQAIERRLLGDVPLDWRPQNKGGDASFFGLGVPMMFGMGAFTKEELEATADANLGWWHHSLECTIDKVDFRWMQDHLRVYAACLWELATAAVLPFEFVSVADQFITRLDELRREPAAHSLDLAGVVARARKFREAARALDAAAQTWRTRYDRGEARDETPAAVLNRCLKRLSNLLIPLQSTVKGVYGHDPYGYTPQATMIPCLHDVPRLARLAAGSEERWMLETQLMRERNRVSDALAAACTLIDGALGNLGAEPRY